MGGERLEEREYEERRQELENQLNDGIPLIEQRARIVRQATHGIPIVAIWIDAQVANEVQMLRDTTGAKMQTVDVMHQKDLIIQQLRDDLSICRQKLEE